LAKNLPGVIRPSLQQPHLKSGFLKQFFYPAALEYLRRHTRKTPASFSVIKGVVGIINNVK
jgi:hypothetical protein